MNTEKLHPMKKCRGHRKKRRGHSLEMLDEAIEQYGDHATRDQNNMLLLREQNALVGRLAWEQQVHICDLNERYLRLLDEKSELVKRNNQPIYESVNIISVTMALFDDADSGSDDDGHDTNPHP